MAEWEKARAIVTGGSRGIGRAVAGMLVAAGARVFLIAREESALRNTVDVLNRMGPGQADFWSVEIGDDEDVCRDVVNRGRQFLGGLTLLVNGAGGATVTSVLEADWSRWHADMNVKFWGYLGMMRAAVPAMKESGGGVIVNLVGITGKDPNPQLAIAGAVNGALRAVSKALADEVGADGIRIVNVNPGATDTDLLRHMSEGFAQAKGMTPEQWVAAARAQGPLRRIPAADDVARLVMFLMSDGAALITGTSIDIDGGVHRGLA